MLSIFNFRSSILENIEKLSLPPLVAWGLFFCLGIVAQFHRGISFIVLCSFAILFLSLSLIFLKKPRLSHFFLFSMAFFLGALALENSKTLPSNAIASLTPFRKQTVVLQGVVLSDPVVSKSKMTFVFGASRFIYGNINGKVSGKVLVRCKDQRDLFYGDELILEGGLYRPFNFPLDKKGGYAYFLKTNGIYSILNVKPENFIRRTGQRKAHRIKFFALLLKHRMDKVISLNLGPFSESVLDAMLLGEGGKVLPAIRDMMIKTGTWHVMVVSGSNTALVALILLLFLKVLRIPRRLRYGLTMGVLVVYCLVTGACSPVMRATVMTIVLLISYMVERNPLIYNSLGLAAMVILLFDPQALFNVGFQLSFVSVFFIAWLFPKIKQFFPQSVLKYPFLHAIVNCFCVSASAWLGTSPLIAYAFGNFSAIAVLANMVIVPLATLVVTAGFALVAVGGVFPSLAKFLAVATEFLIALFLKINLLFSELPFASLTVPRLPWIGIWGYYFLVFLFFNLPVFARKRGKNES